MFRDIWASPPRGFYERLDAESRARVDVAVRRLLSDPRADNATKPLSGPLKGLWSLRVGDLRLLYTINDQDSLIEVRHLGKRESIYDR